jgi:hypothetical protein
VVLRDEIGIRHRHGEEWQKFIYGENNQQAVRNSMDDVAEILRRWEAAGCPDREKEIYI